MALYNIDDPDTGLTLSLEIDKLAQELTEQDIVQAKAKQQERARYLVESGDYQYGGDISRTRMPQAARQEELKRNLALSLNAPYDSINVSSSPLAGIERAELSFRATPEQKFNFLKEKFATESNPDPVRYQNIGGNNELFILEQLPDGSTRYSMVDEEGFTFNDIGDFAVEVVPTLLSVAAVIAPEPTTSAIGLAALGGITYGGSKYVQDLATYGLDAAIQDEYDLNKFVDYASSQALNRTIEGGTTALFDYGFIKGSGYIASIFGKRGADDAIKVLEESQNRIQSRYQGRYDQKIPTVSAVSEKGLAREADAVVESNILQNRNRNALAFLNKIFSDVRGGTPDPSILKRSLEDAAEELNRQAGIAKSSVSRYGYQIQEAIGEAWEEAARRYGINGSFDANTTGEAIQKILFSREGALNRTKNQFYGDTSAQAVKDGVEYTLPETISVLRNVFNEARGKGKGGTSLFDPELASDITVQFNNILKTNFKTLQDVFDSGALQKLFAGKEIPNLTYKELDALLKTINDKAKFGAKSYEKGAHAVMEKAANSLRKLRDSKLFDQNGNPINETGRLQNKASNFYNEKYLGIYRLLDGKALAKKIGSSKNQVFPELQGNQLLDRLIQSPTQNIEEIYRMIPDQEARSFIIDAMQNRYLQNKGANGSLLVSKSNKITIKPDEIRELFGARDLDGKIMDNALTRALVKQKTEAIDNLNKIASKFGSDITSLSAIDINRLLRSNSTESVDRIEKLILGQIRSQKAADDLLKKSLPQLAADGTLAANPSVYMRNIITLPPSDIKKIIGAIEKSDPDGLAMDNFRVAFIEQLQLLAKKDQIGVSAFDPISLQKMLRKGTTEGDNARLILGEEKVKDLEAIARLEEYYSFGEKVSKPSGTIVVGSQGPTGVLGGVQQSVLRKLYGLVVVQDMLRPFRRKMGGKINPEEYTRRMNYMLPLSMVTEKGVLLMSQELGLNPNLSNFFVDELSAIYELGGDGATEQVESQASPRTGENASLENQNTPSAPQAQEVPLPQVYENVSQDPLGLSR